jgi:hypothetical protein
MSLFSLFQLPCIYFLSAKTDFETFDAVFSPLQNDKERFKETFGLGWKMAHDVDQLAVICEKRREVHKEPNSPTITFLDEPH